MKTYIFAFTDNGCIVAKKIALLFTDVQCFALPKFAQKHDILAMESAADKVAEIFSIAQTIIFVGATGIAVRLIAKHIRHKAVDPAVVVVDDGGNFAISLLSGHIGGANEITQKIALHIGAKAVITTATDVNDRFSVDLWAKNNKLLISDLSLAKKVSAKILKESVALKSDFNIVGKLAKGLCIQDDGEIGIYISTSSDKPFKQTLVLTPKILHVGIGCRKGSDINAIKNLLFKVFDENNLNINAIKTISSIDIKKQEQGIIEMAKLLLVDTLFYSAEQLNEVEGCFTDSDFVKQTTGTANVCEKSAVISSLGGKLLVNKTALNGVTVAVATEKWEASFAYE